LVIFIAIATGLATLAVNAIVPDPYGLAVGYVVGVDEASAMLVGSAELQLFFLAIRLPRPLYLGIFQVAIAVPEQQPTGFVQVGCVSPDMTALGLGLTTSIPRVPSLVLDLNTRAVVKRPTKRHD
jgi:hypothetical protein